MDKIKFPQLIRLLIPAVIFCVLVFAPPGVSAEGSQETTQLLIGAPAQTNAGDPITVQAVLGDSQGHPIPKEAIFFTTQVNFLGKVNVVVLAQAVTDGNGQAVAQFTNDFSGTIQLQAEFRGDAQYAPSTASTPVETAGSQQVYAEHVGVEIPGINVPPLQMVSASIQSPISNIRHLWPAINGWPVAAVLLIVWATYFLAVKHVLGISTSDNKEDETTYSQTPNPRRSP